MIVPRRRRWRCRWRRSSKQGSGRRGAALGQPERCRQRIDALNQMDDAVAIVPVIATAVRPAHMQIRLHDGRTHQRPVEGDDTRAVNRPQLLPVLRRLRGKSDFGDLAGCIADHPPFAILVLHVPVAHIAAGRPVCRDERRDSIVPLRHQHIPRKCHPNQSVFAGDIHINLARVVELAAIGARRAGTERDCDEVVPVVVERRSGGQVVQGGWCIKACDERHGHLRLLS